MKIGILTYHYGYNFGGVLQCFALQQTLKELGFSNVQVVNCIPNRVKFYLGGLPRKRRIRTLFDWWLRLRYGRKCRKSFNSFRKNYLNMTAEIKRKSLPALANSFDVLIVGSDQIWNYREQANGMFFLDWKPSFKGVKIAYAPCCGKNLVNEKYRASLNKALIDFHVLTVRNKETQLFVKNLTGIMPSIVPDPTFLYDFRKHIKKRMIKDKYIFVYTLGEEIDGVNKKAIEQIKKKYPNCKVVASVIAYSNPQKVNWADFVFYDVNPIEWLNMIYFADFVFTDSFHGTIFSMKFNVPFIVYYSEEQRKYRFDELIKQFGINSHVVSSMRGVKEYLAQPFFEVNFDEKFNEFSKYGKNILRESLSNLK